LVIVLAVRWYLRFGPSYRDVEELLAEGGIAVDHVTVHGWVQRFTPLLADLAPTYLRVPDALLPPAWHHVERYANNRAEAEHAQLKHRLRAMCRIHTVHRAPILAAGHLFVQSMRRRHYEIAADQPRDRRLPVAFRELARALWVTRRTTCSPPCATTD
jgi:transposase-like protein